MENLQKHAAELLKSGGESFYYSIFKYALVGLMIVNEDTSLAYVNDYMFGFFRQKPGDVSGIMFGNVFRCVAVDCSNLCCGHAHKCKNCDIRNGLNTILDENKTIEDITLSHNFVIDGHEETKWFKVSGCPVKFDGKAYAVLSFADITLLKQYEELLKRQLVLDLATGAMNKYSLLSAMQELLQRHGQDANFTACMVDFDGFKDINDTYGHLMGDKVLETFTEITQRRLSPHDILGRYGGEEFILLFMGGEQETALHTVIAIQNELQEYFAGLLGRPVTFSAGILSVSEKLCHGSQCTDIIAQVDSLLYRAKKLGKNRAVWEDGVHVFGQDDKAIK